MAKKNFQSSSFYDDCFPALFHSLVQARSRLPFIHSVCMLAGWLTAQVQRLLCFELHNVFVSSFFCFSFSQVICCLHCTPLCCVIHLCLLV